MMHFFSAPFCDFCGQILLNMKKYKLLFLLQLICITGFTQPKIWPATKANAWYKQQPWLVGADFFTQHRYQPVRNVAGTNL